MDAEVGIRRAAERACGAEARFQGFFPVVETFRGEVVWEGVVTQFESANGCVYAWAVEGDSEPQFVAVLRKPPVDSPLAAVRAWIASQPRKA